MQFGILPGAVEAEEEQQMNLYLAVSEELSYVAVIDPEIGGPLEYYRIAELVVARNHSQARYLAWKSDKESFRDSWFGIAAMPKFAVRLKEKDVEGPARIATEEWQKKADEDVGAETEGYSQWTYDLWDVGKAPHIGYGGEDG